MEKYQKNTKIQSVFFFVFYLYLFRIFFLFLQQKCEKKYKKNTKTIRMQLLKNTKYKTNTNQQFQKYKIQKKYEPKI